MGIVISTHSPTSPFFITSGIIGFVGFAFTLATFFKVVWTNIGTMTEAPHEVHAYLTNLRQELLEEKNSVRVMRKGMRSHQRECKRDGRADLLGIELDEVTLKTMGDSIKRLIKSFRELERPFLEDGEAGIDDAINHRRGSRRRNSSSDPPRYSHGAYASPPEKKRARSKHDGDGHLVTEKDEEDDMFWAQRTNYASFTVKRRLQWLRRKPQAQRMFDTLARVQTRRIARQVGGMALCMHVYGQGTLELKEAVQRIDERMNRVVGVRRVD